MYQLHTQDLADTYCSCSTYFRLHIVLLVWRLDYEIVYNPQKQFTSDVVSCFSTPVPNRFREYLMYCIMTANCAMVVTFTALEVLVNHNNTHAWE